MQANKNSIYASIVSLLLLTFISACAEMDSHSSISRFQKSEDILRASMRWGEWENALSVLKPNPDSTNNKLQPPSEEYLRYLDTIKVAHIEVLKSGITVEDKAGESLFLIEYHFDNSTRIQKLRHKVDWWYDKEANLWYSNTPLPKVFDLPKHRTIRLSPK